jgi:NAD+ diphosphatase
MEEAGVEVEQPVYAGSQPWPFPHQLMVGFNAQYASGLIRIDDEELDDARWFQVDELPTLPAPLSLSRRLNDAWIASRRR